LSTTSGSCATPTHRPPHSRSGISLTPMGSSLPASPRCGHGRTVDALFAGSVTALWLRTTATRLGLCAATSADPATRLRGCQATTSISGGEVSPSPRIWASRRSTPTSMAALLLPRRSQTASWRCCTASPPLRRSDPRPPDLHSCRSGGLFLSPLGHGTVTIKVFCPTGLTPPSALPYVYPIAPDERTRTGSAGRG